MPAGGKEDLFGVDGRLGTVVENDFNVILAEEVCSPVDVLDLVVVEVLLVDAV